ncbi:Leucine--tRNA ligase [compost metagenome]
MTIAVQINGKLRGTIDLPRDAAAREVEEAALALPQVVRFLDGRAPKKIVVVPNRIVSVVA